jgi:hypothetical protein
MPADVASKVSNRPCFGWATAEDDVATRGGLVVVAAACEVVVLGFTVAGGVVGVEVAAGCEVCGRDIEGAGDCVEPSASGVVDPSESEPADPAGGWELSVDGAAPSPVLADVPSPSDV